MVSKRSKIMIAVIVLTLIVFAIAWLVEYKITPSPLNPNNINQNIKDVLKQYNDTKDLINAMTVALIGKDKNAKPPTCNPFQKTSDDINLTKTEDIASFALYVKDLTNIKTSISSLKETLAKYRIETAKLQINTDKTGSSPNWVDIESIVTPDLTTSMKNALISFTRDLGPFLDTISNAPPCNTYCGATEDTKWIGDGTVYPSCICTTGYTKPNVQGNAIKCLLTAHSTEADQLIKQYNTNMTLINKNFALSSKDSEGCDKWNATLLGAC